MHIAVLSARFTPEASPGAKRVTDLVSALYGAGHRTTVLTQLPNYPDSAAFSNFPCDAGPVTIRHDAAGNEIRRFRPTLTAKGNLRARLLAEARFAYRVSQPGTHLTGFDGVFATSPYILTLCSARSYRAPMWLDLRDLTWEYSRQLGPRGILYRLGYRIMKSLALACFAAAARVSTTTERQRQYLIDQGIPSKKVDVVPNGVPKDIVADLGRLEAAPRNDGPLRVVYAGLLGFPQGLAFAVESIEGMSPSEVELHLYGDGVDRPAITSYCQSRGLRHIRLHGHIPYEQYLKALASADILYTSLRPGDSLEAAMPSKIYEYMAAQRPILFAGVGEAAEVVSRAQAGICVPFGDKAGLQKQLRRLLADEDYRRECGANGRCWVINHHIRESINAAWVDAMADVFLSHSQLRRARVAAKPRL